MEVSRSSLTFFQRNHDLKEPFVACLADASRQAQRIVLSYALKFKASTDMISVAKTTHE